MKSSSGIEIELQFKFTSSVVEVEKRSEPRTGLELWSSYTIFQAPDTWGLVDKQLDPRRNPIMPMVSSKSTSGLLPVLLKGNRDE